LASVVVASVAVLLNACGGSSELSTSSSPATPSPTGGGSMTAAETFLSTYVDADGRVLRHDQGDDVVSEGQAYGMLIAQLAGRDDLVRTIWAWTRTHLQESSGLLAYHASGDGHVLDRQPAADADVLTAYALLRTPGSDESGLHADGRRVAAAVMRHETVRDSAGRPVLVAGPWATKPAVVNPSYWMPSVFDELADLTDDPAWRQMTTATVELTEQATDRGSQLPPDWGRLDGDQVTPTGSGGGDGPPQYGPDAQRVPLWFGSSCDPAARDLAASWWSVLQQDGRSSASALSMEGTDADPTGSTVALVASAAAARAAHDDSAAADLELGAEQLDHGQPTYYGAAWRALAQGLKEGDLAACSR
jgi:endoglucanase